MTNKEAFSLSVSDWFKPIAKSIIPSINIPASKPIAGFMGNFLGIDLSNYNLMDELDFLVEPTIESFVAPIIENMLSKVPDERIPSMMNTYLDSFISRAKEKGSINIYGIPLEEKHFVNLQSRFNEYLKKVKKNK